MTATATRPAAASLGSRALWHASAGTGGETPEPPGGDYIGKATVIGQPTRNGRPGWRTEDLVALYVKLPVGAYTAIVKVT